MTKLIHSSGFIDELCTKLFNYGCNSFSPAFTQFPIARTIIGTVLITLGLVRKNIVLNRTALVTFIAIALMSIPVYLTGEEAEEAIETLARRIRTSN